MHQYSAAGGHVFVVDVAGEYPVTRVYLNTDTDLAETRVTFRPEVDLICHYPLNV